MYIYMYMRTYAHADTHVSKYVHYEHLITRHTLTHRASLETGAMHPALSGTSCTRLGLLLPTSLCSSRASTTHTGARYSFGNAINRSCGLAVVPVRSYAWHEPVTKDDIISPK